MERRELLKLVALATGATLAVPLSSGVLTACANVEKVEESSYALQFFSKDEFALAKEMLDLILPRTDSPSAVEVGVHQVMDHMAGKVFGEDERKNFAKQYGILQEYLSSGQLEERVRELIASDKAADKPAKMAFLGFKQQAVTYYLSTKEIGTKYLNFLPIPGKYEPCISLESVEGKAWTI